MRPRNGAGKGCFPRADAGGICAARRTFSRAGCGAQQTSDLPYLPLFVVAPPRWSTPMCCTVDHLGYEAPPTCSEERRVLLRSAYQSMKLVAASVKPC